MNISIGARVGAGFITMLIILVACGTAGIYGVNKVSESLLFVSGDARATSDSGKLISSNLQAEMLITERILSNDISKRDGRKLMRDHVKASKAALQTLQDAGLIDEQFIKKTDDTIRRYRGASLSILASYSELQGQQDRLRQIINNILDETTATQDKLQDLISQNLYDVTYVSRLETIEDQLDQIRLNTILTSSSLEQIFTSSDFPSQLDKIKTDREQLSAVIEQTVQAMSMPALAEPADKIKQSYTRLDQQASQMIVDYMTFRDDRKNLSVIINQLLKTLAEVEAESASLVETEVANVDDLVATSSTLIIVAAGVGVLVALLALGVIIFTVVYPIRNVAQNLEQIGLGEGDLNVSLKEAGASELVTLARGFNGFVGKIRHTISGVSDSISDLSESTHNLRQISSAATTAIQQQTAETEQAAAAVHEMTATANTVASHAQEAANAAAAADSSAAQGNRQVNTTIDTINKQLSELDTAAKVVEQLASDSDSIASVLDVINDIAEQTNLLALNAAIEAARAGDAGRGFAVVADEVRKLASRTQTATTEIQVVVTKLHDAAGKAVKAMQNSLEARQQSAFQAEQSGQSISAITLESNTISEMTLQIASAAEEQASVAETINQNVVTISERAQDTYSASQDIEHATQQLTQLSQRLKSLVSEFKH